MKILKKFLSFIVGFILYILLLAFSLNLVIKGVIQKQIVGGVAKDQIISEYLNKSDVENKEEIRKILEDKDATKIANTVVDEYIEYLSDNNHKVSKKTVNSILDFCIKHREQINKFSKENVTEEELKSPETYNDLEKAINESFSEIEHEIGDAPIQVIKVYSNLTSNNFQTLLIISIIICIILLMIIKSSLYKWMSSVGGSLISIGVMILGLYFALGIVVQEIQKQFDFDIVIKLNDMITIGIMEILIGVILIVIKVIINKIQNSSKTTPVTISSQPTPSQPTPSQPTSIQSTPSQTTSIQSTPSQSTPSQQPPIQSTPSQPTSENSNIEQ